MLEHVGRRGVRCPTCKGSGVYRGRVKEKNDLQNQGRKYQVCRGCGHFMWLDGIGIWPSNPLCSGCRYPCRLQKQRPRSGWQLCCAYRSCKDRVEISDDKAEGWIDMFLCGVQMHLSRLAGEERRLRRCGLPESAPEMERLLVRQGDLNGQRDQALEMKKFLQRRRELAMGNAIAGSCEAT
ncbi:hypothetical protein BO99DRAFT_406774 [Aspergillus violaceofuscus CBS 115571]|uniref:GRF-like zinc ribbon domain-containing protein n=1 Tax=Aspergillus violaceofuscus (strain CBS 115571) TaxID=1450538 RepID=A0A2V5H0N1_ASPV1|nr:hypothetical protein BO99DRAFT_406774 [Aspergillus violaceofuscus CBS 115571]